jgi:septal ring factor EnvC (AmiA/AmiB activator)
MFTAGGTLASLLAVFAPVLKVFLEAFGTTFNASQAAKRAEQTQRDLGRVTAERDQEAAAREATQRELEALQAAPQTVDDAISRLEEGSA